MVDYCDCLMLCWWFICFLIWLFSDYCFGWLALVGFGLALGYVGFWWLLCGLLWLFVELVAGGALVGCCCLFW